MSASGPLVFIFSNFQYIELTVKILIRDLGLHCLSMSHKKDARLIWDNATKPVHLHFV